MREDLRRSLAYSARRSRLSKTVIPNNMYDARSSAVTSIVIVGQQTIHRPTQAVNHVTSAASRWDRTGFKGLRRHPHVLVSELLA